MMRKNYRNYTRVIKQKLQSFFDISTSTSEYQILKFNAGGDDIISRMPGMFGSFKYFRLGNLSVTAVPQSTLPVDPTGLSYEQGENTVSPSDQLTPGLIRITNGEDMRGFGVGSPSLQEITKAEYTAMMLDPRWFKFMLQSGFKRSCSPRFWGIGMLHQMETPGQVVNLLASRGTTTTDYDGNIVRHGFGATINGGDISFSEYSELASDEHGIFQTGQKIRMGWLPTDVFQGRFGSNAEKSYVKSVPECQCITVILPKAEKTRYYYRVFVTETVYFKDPIVRAPYFSDGGLSINPIDYQNTLQLGNSVSYWSSAGGTTGNTGDNGGVN